MWWILYIFMISFFVLRKSSFPPWPCTLFSKYFYPNPWWCFQLILISQYAALLKSLHICHKKRPRKFSWIYERNRMPSAKHLSQTPFSRFRLRASLVIEYFLLKLKTINYVLWTWYFSQWHEGQLLWTSLFLQIL